MVTLLLSESTNISDAFTDHFQSVFIITSLIVTSHHAKPDFLSTDSSSGVEVIRAIKHLKTSKCVDTDDI
jgi:hypothetical protein